jgi:hypothetical protein
MSGERTVSVRLLALPRRRDSASSAGQPHDGPDMVVPSLGRGLAGSPWTGAWDCSCPDSGQPGRTTLRNGSHGRIAGDPVDGHHPAAVHRGRPVSPRPGARQAARVIAAAVVGQNIGPAWCSSAVCPGQPGLAVGAARAHRAGRPGPLLLTAPGVFVPGGRRRVRTCRCGRQTPRSRLRPSSTAAPDCGGPVPTAARACPRTATPELGRLRRPRGGGDPESFHRHDPGRLACPRSCCGASPAAPRWPAARSSYPVPAECSPAV